MKLYMPRRIPMDMRLEGSVTAASADSVGNMRAGNAEIAKDMIIQCGKLADCSTLFRKTFNRLKNSHRIVSFVSAR